MNGVAVVPTVARQSPPPAAEIFEPGAFKTGVRNGKAWAYLHGRMLQKRVHDFETLRRSRSV
jgi:hypothetical protein